MRTGFFVKYLAAALILTSLTNGVVPAYACSCIQPSPPLDSLQHSDAVFTGTVIAITGLPAGGGPVSSAAPVNVEFQISKIWKGSSSQNLVVETALEGASCGLGRTFMVGEEYLVYATMDSGRLTTNLCSRTTHISNAQGDITELDRGSTLKPDLPNMLTTYLILGVVLVALVLIIVKRKRGQAR